MVFPRRRIRALPFRRGPDGSAFQQCESCGLSVAIALADLHECALDRANKKAKTQCGSKSRKGKSKNGEELGLQPAGSDFQQCEVCGLSVAIGLFDLHGCEIDKAIEKAKTQRESKSRKVQSKNGEELRFQGQPRSAFRLFMEEFMKKCNGDDEIDADRRGFETWREMSKMERQPFELRAKKIWSVYSKSLIKEENNMHWVDDEADSAEVGKYDVAYEDYMCPDDYDNSGGSFSLYSDDDSESLNSHLKWKLKNAWLFF